MSKRKIPKPKKQNKLPVCELHISDDLLKAQFSFKWCADNTCLLSEWGGRQLDKLIYCFKRLGNAIWRDIKTDRKFNYKTIDYPKINPPGNLPPDFIKLKSIEVGEIERIYGYRTGAVFSIVFFDCKHQVC
ncbi:MAG: hypothetical protein JW770_01600 [Actinobacteria bacterium]|nr:hypothetical protein [Actinomycetota bacterium]